ncbi:MAG: PepSY domain-containing protein [Halioglobus sp.]
MKLNAIHKILGLIMIAPLILWAITGLIFLTKPGYSNAYEQLSPALYQFDKTARVSGAANWTDIRLLKTVLGYHLLVQESGSWKHLDPFTLAVKSQPSPEQVKALIQDATKASPSRYGTISAIQENTVITDTDVVITLDWNSLTLKQEGRDTRLINTLYKVHYLQWFDSPLHNKIFGILGLILLVALSVLGCVTYIRGRKNELN